MATHNGDDDLEFGWEFPCWVPKVAPFVALLLLVWVLRKFDKRRTSSRRSRQDAMIHGFDKAVDSVAKQVILKPEEEEEEEEVLPLFRACRSRKPPSPPPLSGKYRCVMRYQEITSLVTNETMFGGISPAAYVLNLDVVVDADYHWKPKVQR